MKRKKNPRSYVKHKKRYCAQWGHAKEELNENADWNLSTNCVQISHFEVSATFPPCFRQSEIVSSSSHTVKALDVFLCLRILWFQIKFLVIPQTSYISQVCVDRKLFPCGNSQELHWAKSVLLIQTLLTGIKKSTFQNLFF